MVEAPEYTRFVPSLSRNYGKVEVVQEEGGEPQELLYEVLTTDDESGIEAVRILGYPEYSGPFMGEFDVIGCRLPEEEQRGAIEDSLAQLIFEGIESTEIPFQYGGHQIPSDLGGTPPSEVTELKNGDYVRQDEVYVPARQAGVISLDEARTRLEPENGRDEVQTKITPEQGADVAWAGVNSELDD